MDTGINIHHEMFAITGHPGTSVAENFFKNMENSPYIGTTWVSNLPHRTILNDTKILDIRRTQ
jgi:hypothetical protein